MANQSKIIRYMVYDTAIGDVTILADDKAIVGLYLDAVDPEGCINEENVPLLDAIMELNKYCYGQSKALDMRLNPPGDAFAKQVFDYVRTIPYGKTMTYEQVAKALGEPGGGKEVRDTLAENPIPFFIPCHRVVGEGNDLGVYVGSLELKQKILAMERINADREFRPNA